MRMVRITCDVEWDRLDTILGVLHQEVSNVHVDEIIGEPSLTVSEPVQQRMRRPGLNHAVLFWWPLLRPVFERANGCAVWFKSEEIKTIFSSRGRNPNGASTVFTNLNRAGLVEWVGRGLYKLKREQMP